MRWGWAVLLMGLPGATAWAGEGPEPVVVDLTDAVRVDWTALRVEVREAARHPTFRQDLTFAEQAALDKVAAQVPSAVEAVRVRDGVTADRLEDVGARALAAWSVVETRYHRGGRVEVVGAVDLRPVLGPWMASRADVPPSGADEDGASGIVLDARHTAVQPCYAPRLLGHDGEVRFDGEVWQDVATGTPPARWVSTPADPVAGQTAGDRPVFLSAASADGCALVLTADATAAWDAEVRGRRIAGEGRLVLVVSARPAGSTQVATP